MHICHTSRHIIIPRHTCLGTLHVCGHTECGGDTESGLGAAHLMAKLRKQTSVLQELHDHGISETKAAHGLVFAPQRSEEAVIATSSTDGPERTLPVKALEDNACRSTASLRMLCGWKFSNETLASAW